MLRPVKNNALRIVGYAASTLGVAIAAVACTHDFDAYQATGEGVSSTPDGSPEGSSTDGAATLDAGGDTACATAPMCAATSTMCKATCESTLTACSAQCSGGGGQQCKAKCKSERDKCLQACTTTCGTCAGTGCTAACN